MKVLLGETGLQETFQENFPKTTPCCKCGREARIMFVASEMESEEFVTDLRDNGGEGDYWVHDAMACGVYLCRDCFEATAIINQA